MFSRYKLQITFMGLALFALTVFGIVAYDSSLKIRMQQEIKILKNFSKYIIKDIARHSSSNEAIQDYLNHENFLPDNYLLVIKKEKNILTPSKNMNALKNLPYQKLFTSKESNGFFEYSKKEFTWDKVETDIFHAILFHQLPNNSFNTFFTSLGLPLIIAGIIIMWLVFWATLMLNTVIVKLKEKNISMQHMLMHDPLTSLPNRFSLHEKIDQSIKDANGEKSTFAIIIIDLKRFKEINDTLGHHFGDALLIAVSDSLQDKFDEPVVAARFSGDKFAVLIPGVNQLSFLKTIEYLQNIFCRSYELGGHKIYTDASMGAAFFPEHGLDSATLTQRAEMTMYIAKRTGKIYSIYNPEEDTSNIETMELSNDLRHAMDNQEFELYYQPQTNFSDGKCNYFEALIRWQHPTKGYIPPDKFILLAENLGIINNISQWVLDSAIKQCSQWRKEGYNFNVAVNLSAWDIQDQALPSRIQLPLETHHLPSNALIVEVTETAITLNEKQAAKTLNQLSDIGIKVALDDFGTGFSSLNHLRLSAIDEVKIDRSFISSMLSNSDDLHLVKGIIDLSHNLGIAVVAEGVETKEEANTLIDYQCDRLQGYYYSKAMPANKVLDYLKDCHLLKKTSNT